MKCNALNYNYYQVTDRSLFPFFGHATEPLNILSVQYSKYFDSFSFHLRPNFSYELRTTILYMKISMFIEIYCCIIVRCRDSLKVSIAQSQNIAFCYYWIFNWNNKKKGEDISLAKWNKFPMQEGIIEFCADFISKPKITCCLIHFGFGLTIFESFWHFFSVVNVAQTFKHI